MRFRDFLTEWSNMSKGIRREMESKGYKFLGAGVDQAAYLEPKTGKVLKIFGTQYEDYTDDNGFTREHLMFKHWADYCAKRKGNIFLPKFDGWESFEYEGNKYLQIRMERLAPLPNQLAVALHRLTDVIDNSLNPSKFIKNILKHAADLSAYNKSIGPYDEELTLDKKETLEIEKLVVLLGEEKFTEFLKTMLELARLASKSGYTFDLHGRNFMHRNDGTPVIVDPWVI